MNSFSSAKHCGFIYQATYRIHQTVPVVYLFGRLDNGETFLVRDHHQTPHFFVTRSAADNLEKGVVNARISNSEMKSMDGQPLVRLDVRIPADAPTVRETLHSQGVNTYEADIRFAVSYLINRGIKGGVEIIGKAQRGEGTHWQFENPELTPSDVIVPPKVLSFDIETHPANDELLAIACYGCGVDEVVVVDKHNRLMPDKAVRVADELAALRYFTDLVQKLDVDVLTGWNVIDFDLSFLARIAARHNFSLQLGRERGALRIRAAQGYFGSGSASVPGRIVLDGIDLLRGAFVKMEDYSLDTVAQSVLGEGKTLGGEQRDKVAEILHTYAHDLPRFTEYARTDARLALEILEQLKLIDLALARSALTGMTPDRVAASIASFDFLYLSALHKRKIAAPTVNTQQRSAGPQSGGAVYEPVVGIHNNVWVCDFKSLYPSIMRTFNIDPLAFAQGQQARDVIRTHDGTAFARGSSILPNMLDTLFPKREQAKRDGDAIASQAIKILMNSFYGVLGTPACRFYNPAIANAITSQGRYLLGWSKQWFEQQGFQVLYGDTDSVFVASGAADAEIAQAAAPQWVSQFNSALTQHLLDTAGVESQLELEFEKLYTQLYLASIRGGSQGARKRYAGMRYGSDELEFVGMEVVRRDWTELAKQVQRNLFGRLFASLPKDGHSQSASVSETAAEVAAYLKQEVEALRAGQFDHMLVYRKNLRKEVSRYTTNVPPHVQAVKKSTQPPPRVVAYVMTTAGPELVSEIHHPLDREHYVTRQIQPIAEPVLETLGLEFSQVIGDDRQIALF